MKILFLISLTMLSIISYGQDKYNFVSFNNFIEIKGTEFVVAQIENRGKMEGLKNRLLLFIDTKSGQTNQVEFPSNGYLNKVEQIKLDSLAINCLLVSAQTVDLDGKKGIDYNDPVQIIILSPDGKLKTQLTDSNFFVRTWAINALTGNIVVGGHYDTNKNGKHDKSDKNEIVIYDLKSLKLISKI